MLQVIYVLDDGTITAKLHTDARSRSLDRTDAATLRSLLEEHAAETGSARAEALLAHWPETLQRFVAITPA